MHCGQPLRLLPFQRKFILDTYDNPSRTSFAILSMARKNGKTALIAALVLAHLAGPVALPNSQIVSGAQSRDQASLVFKLARKMVEMSPELSSLVRVVPSRKTLVGLALNTEYEALSAEAKAIHGLSPVLAILDETGQVRGPQDDFIDAITTAQGAHDHPLLICISTQAATDSDLLSVWIDDALESNDPHTICHLYAADKDCELTDAEAWTAANPALGEFRSKPDVEKQAKKAARMPSQEPTFRNLILNQRVETTAPFISKSLWKDNAAPIDEALFLQQPVVAGLDLSGRIDLTALVLSTVAENGVVHLKPLFWTPEQGLADRAKRDRSPYVVWAGSGFLKTTPGGSVDYAFVAQAIGDLIDNGVNLTHIAYDRWRIDIMRKELDRLGIGVELVPFGQGFKDFSPAMDEFEDKLANKEVAHGDHPVLAMCAFNSVVRKDEAGNRKLDKKRATGRIDGMVAATMAVALLAQQETDEGIYAL
jgi:phage terminase large subunit-like protein